MKSSQLFLAILMGCTQDEGRDQGTVVGNPGDAALRMGSVDAGQVITARTTVSAMSLETCTGRATEVELDEEIDFLDDVRIEIPNGAWCSLTLFTEDSLFIETVSDDEKAFLALDLDLAALEFESAEGFSVDGDPAILEWGFPGWLSMESEMLFEQLDIEEDDIEEREGEEDILVIEVGPEDEDVHDELVDVFAHGSGLYGDDGDGRLSDDERKDSLWAAGADHPVASDEEAPEDEPPVVESDSTMGADARLATGPGCAKSESSLQWAVVLPLMLLGWRREQGPH